MASFICGGKQNKIIKKNELKWFTIMAEIHNGVTCISHVLEYTTNKL